MMKFLLSGYPYLSLTDPKGYISNIITILCEYPKHISEEAIRFIADQNGRHPPTRFDVRQRCQDLYAAERTREIRRLNVRRQLAERDSLDLLPPPTQTIDELRTEMLSRGFPMNNGRKVHKETPATIMAKYGLTPEEWAALPDDTNRGGTNWKKAKP